MLYAFILFIAPVTIVLIFLGIKYYIHKQHIEEGVLPSDAHNFEDAKEMVFGFTDFSKSFVAKNLKIFIHWILHIFVIVLGFISDITDYLYEKSRDFFLRTATREKDVVSAFWHHLKEYKREKDSE